MQARPLQLQRVGHSCIRAFIRAAAVVACGHFCVSSQAAEREDLLRAQEQQRQQALRDQSSGPAPTLRAGVAAARQPYPLEPAPCFSLHTLALPADMPPRLQRGLQSEWAIVREHCLGALGLGALSANLNSHVREAGYPTSRIELPAQNLSQGVLAAHWLPGSVKLVRELPGAVGRSSLPLAADHTLTIADLDQAADWYNRLPSLAARLLVLPTDEPLAHIVEVQVQAARPWRASLTVDNSSPHEFGVAQASAQIALDRPSALLGLAPLLDQLALDLGANPQRHSAYRSNLNVGWNYSLPLGYHLFAIHGRSGQSARRIQGTSVDFVQHGNDSSTGARWTWTWQRSAQTKANLWLAAERRGAHRDIDDVELVLQRRKTLAAEVGGNLWLRSSVAGRTLDWAIDASLARVKRRVALDAFEPEPVPKMREGRLTVATSVPWLPDGASGAAPRVDIKLSLHRVANPIAPSDLPLIGTRYAVRGFNGDTPLQGPQAAVLRTDWRWPAVAVRNGMAQVSPYLGLDIGAVRNPPTANPPQRWLSGMVLGMQGRSGPAVLELAMATSLHAAQGIPARHWVPSVSLSVDI